jgi:hypothetical protein
MEFRRAAAATPGNEIDSGLGSANKSSTVFGFTGFRPYKNIRVTGGKGGPGRTPGSSPDRIDIETLAHVEAEHA